MKHQFGFLRNAQSKVHDHLFFCLSALPGSSTVKKPSRVQYFQQTVEYARLWKWLETEGQECPSRERAEQGSSHNGYRSDLKTLIICQDAHEPGESP